MLAVALSAFSLLASSAVARPNVYLNSFFLNFVSAYSVAPDGSLAPVAGSPFATGIAPYLMAMTPDRRYLYVGNFESADVSAYSVAPDGSLAPVAGSPFHTGTWPWGVAVSPDGAHLFVVNNGSDSISSFSIAPDGSLAPVAGSPFATASGARSNGVAVTPDGKYLYVPSGDKHSIVALSIASDGSLSPVVGSPFEAGLTPREVSVTPDGKYLYVSNVSSGTISAFSIAADGSLSQVPGGPFDTEGAPESLAVTPDGKHLYVTHIGADEGVVWGYSIAPDGGLSPILGAPFATGGFRSGAMTASPDGKHLYVTSKHAGGPEIVSGYSIAPNGSLSMLAGFPQPTEEGDSISITPDQGPTAAFSSMSTPAEDPSVFDASGSSDPDGSVVTYEWDFGDGQELITPTATAAHTYAAPGEYTVTLTVSDNESCSTVQIFTGQTVSCNGSSLAEASHQVTVAPGVPLGVSLTGSGGGSVTSDPTGIACPEACRYAYEPDTQVTLTASPAPDSTFTGWSGGGCSGTGACEVSSKADTNVIADFSKLPPPPPELPAHELTIDLDGNGRGSVEDGTRAIACPPACSHSYAAGRQVTLVPTPAPGSTFAGWSGGCTGVDACRLIVGADTTLTATFEKIRQRARLRIRHVRLRRVGSQCPAGLIFATPRPLARACLESTIVVGGTIVKHARGAVRVRIRTILHGNLAIATRWARIHGGSWQASLTSLVIGSHFTAPVYVTSSFGGSPGVSSSHARRWVRTLDR